MAKKNSSDLFFACSLVEQLGRDLLAKRSDVVSALGKEGIDQIYEYADVFHCEPIAKVSDDFIQLYSLKRGTFDNVGVARYEIPSVWTMGKIHSRLIEDVAGEKEYPDTLIEVYTSWIEDFLSDYNSTYYFQTREFLTLSYKEGKMLDWP